jgi:hypothetical protein
VSQYRDKHEAVLAQSLESTSKFGDPFTLENDTGSLTYPVTGKFSVNTKPNKEKSDGVIGRYARFVVRYSTIATLAGRGTDPNWQDNMPKAGWTIVGINPITKILEAYIIEPGSVLENHDLGIITYVPAQIAIEVAP